MPEFQTPARPSYGDALSTTLKCTHSGRNTVRCVVCCSLWHFSPPMSRRPPRNRRLFCAITGRFNRRRKFSENGAALSAAGFQPRGWYPCHRALHGLQRAGAGARVSRPLLRHESAVGAGRQLPDRRELLERCRCRQDSPFRKPWWFRTEFKLPAEYRGKTLWLGFDGINFRANVWLNGKQIAASDKLAGAWRLFEFDVTRRGASRATPTRSPSRSSRPSPAISRSRSSIGTRCRRTRSWACGAMSRSPPPGRSRSAIPFVTTHLRGRRAQLTRARRIDERHRRARWMACSRDGSRRRSSRSRETRRA